MNRLLELREAAKQCSNVEYRVMLKNTADDIEHYINLVKEHPDNNTMMLLNCMWSQGERLLKNVPPEGSPAPVTDAMEEPMRMAA